MEKVINLKNRFFPLLRSVSTIITLIFLMSLMLYSQEIVDPHTGQLSLKVTDLEINAGPVLLQIQRTLFPSEGQVGLLGSQWLLNWESKLLRSDSVVFVYEDNYLITFDQSDDKSVLQGPTGERIVLREDGRAVLNRPDGTKATYDNIGRLIEKQDANGNSIILRYGEDGNLARLEGPNDIYLDFNTDDKGRVILIEASTGNKVRYSYEGEYLVLVQVNDGPPTIYGYDEKAALIHIDRPKTGEVKLAYDAKGRVTFRSRADGTVEFYEYNDDTQTIRHMHQGGGTTTYHRSKDGRREEIIDPLGSKTTIMYNESLLPISVTGPTGATSRIEYDSQGRVTGVYGCCGAGSIFEYVGSTQRFKSIIESDGTSYDYTYDERGNLLFIKRGSDIIYSFTYYSDGLLKSMKGLDLPERKFTYYPSGLLKSETNALGYTTFFEYDKRGNLIKETNPLGGETIRVYDKQNRLVSLTDPAKATTHYFYNEAGLGIKVKDPLGGVHKYDYDSLGRIKSMTDPDGRTTRYEYDTGGRLKSMTDPAGNAFSYIYDPIGNLIVEINPLGGKTYWTYNPWGLVLSETDPTGRTWDYEYSDSGLLTKITDPSKGIMKYKYDEHGRCIEETDQEGRTTRYEYDNMGWISKISYPDGLVETSAYDTAGNLIREMDNRGMDIQYEYDPLGRLIKESDGLGFVKTYSYDALGNTLEWRDNLGGARSFEYNAQELISVVKEATGAITQYRYDLYGRLLEEINPLGHRMNRAYTKAGELYQVKDPSGETTTFTCDPLGALSYIRHPGGGDSHFSYDPMGNSIKVTNPLGATIRNAYDKAGRLTSITDAKGQTTTFAYDDVGRLAQKKRPDGEVVKYKYSASDDLIEVDDGTFPIRLTYGRGGLLALIEYPAVQRNLKYEYDGTGRLSKFVDSEGRTVSYNYGSTGLLSSIQYSDGQVFSFNYDIKERLTETIYPNGVKCIWEYDSLDRPVQIKYTDRNSKSFLTWQYSYDAAGNLLKVIDSKGNVTRYKYDNIGQLLEESGPFGTIRYSYLPGGNRGKQISGKRTINYHYNKADQLVKAGEVSFTYDANGNLIERRGPQGTTRFQYDAENRLIRVTKPDGTDMSFGYAPTGERIWRKDSSGITWFVTDGINLLAELDENLKPKALYLHELEIDSPLMIFKDGQYYFYHANHLGSVAALTDSKGKLVATYKTDAFGNLLEKKGTVHNPFYFTARAYEPDIGLYYYRARYYDPALGRFMNQDPEWGPSRLNRYAYVQNAPTRYRDPWGLSPDELSNRLSSSDIKSLKRVIYLRAMRLRLKDQLSGLPEWSMERYYNMAKTELTNGLKRLPKDMTVEKAIRIEQNLEVRQIKYYQNLKKLSPSERAYVRLSDRRFDKMLEAARRRSESPAGYYKTRANPNAPPPREGIFGRGEKTQFRRSPSGTILKREVSVLPGEHTKPPPSISVPTQPGPKWNPQYRGPTGMNRGPDANNWKPIAPEKPPGSGTSPSGQSPQWHERHALPILTVLVTTEIIIRCRNEGLSFEQCGKRLLTAAAVAAGVALTIAAIPATAPFIMVAGVGLMSLKAYNDLVEYAYEGGSAWEAKWRLERIEKKRKGETQFYLRERLEADLSRIRERINQALEGPVQELEEVCATLEKIVQDVATYGEEAGQILTELPSQEMVDKWGRVAGRCQTMSVIQGELETIHSSLQAEIQKVRAEFTLAESIDCDSESEAIQIQQSSEAIVKVLTGIQERISVVDRLKMDIATIIADIPSTKDGLNEAIALRDDISSLTAKLPSNETVKSYIEQGKAAKKTLVDRAKQLEASLWRIQKGYPDDMDAKTEQRFFELRHLVNVYKYKVKCNPESFLAQYNAGAEMVVKAKLRVENRLGSLPSIKADLSLCDTEAIRTLLSAIEEVKSAAKRLEGLNRSLSKKADDCLKRLSSPEEEDEPPLIKVLKGKKGVKPKPKPDEDEPPLIKALKGKKGVKPKPSDVEHIYPSDFDPTKDFEIVAIYAGWKNVRCQIGSTTFQIKKVLDVNKTEVIVRQNGKDTVKFGKEALRILTVNNLFYYEKDCGYRPTRAFDTWGPGVTQEADKDKKPYQPGTAQLRAQCKIECECKYCGKECCYAEEGLLGMALGCPDCLKKNKSLIQECIEECLKRRKK